MTPRPYVRYPHVTGDLVTFVAGDDVWLAPADGGRASKLSDDLAPVTNPRISPDGAHIAWTSTRHGAPEVLVTSVDGGEAQRLTYWGNPRTLVIGWRSTGEIFVVSGAGENHITRDHWLRSVSLDGRADRLPVGPVSGIATEPSSRGKGMVVSTPWSREPAHWKRYRGGTAVRLWIDRDGDGSFERLLPEIRSGLAWPIWVGERIAFTSDHEGVGNLWSVLPDGSDLRQHTHHRPDDGYVRTPTTDGTRIVYHSLGDVYMMDSLDSAPRRLDLQLGAVAAGRATRMLDAADELAAASPVDGRSGSVVQVRGAAYFLTHRAGPARALAADAGVRVRDAQPLGAAQSAVYVTDADGEDALEVCPVDGGTPVRLAAGELGRVLSLCAAPDGERVAVVTHDGRILVIEIPSGMMREAGRSPDGEATGLAFSPDSSWLAWSQPVDEHHAGLRLAPTSGHTHGGDTRAPIEVTSGRFRDFSPSFTRDGKHLAFLSTRTFDPVYDVHTFDISFPAGTRPFLIPLTADTPSPFGPDVAGWRLDPSAPPDGDRPGDGATSSDADPSTPPITSVDADGLEARAVAFPVVAGSYRNLECVPDGVAWLREPASGTLGHDRPSLADPPPRPSLEHYAFAGRKLTVLAEAVDDYRTSPGGRHLAIRDKRDLVIMPSDRKVEDDDDARVVVDLSRIRHLLEPVAEWRQMYTESARIMRDHFWHPEMNGTDWDAAVERYRPVVDRLGSHDDLVDLLWEVQAELGTSHAYVLPPDGDPPADRLGFLGADVVADGASGWTISRILAGESSDPAATSPLRAPGVGAQTGDRIIAIDGRPVDPVFGPAAGLHGAAGQPIELEIAPAAGGDARRVAVVPLASEEQIRYHEWVADRREHVRSRAQGRLGYLHIPDMVASGWAQVHRDVTEATNAEGTIVDVRYNRGGHLSQLVIERLSRRIRAYALGRHHADERYPWQAPRGPVVFICNQWTGSDGDIVTAVAKQMGVGPVIGERTWGGVIGIDGRFKLVDGTTVTQPRYAFWIDGYGWDVENHGVDPDIEVPMAPHDHGAGGDPQLDRAIDEALELLEREPASVPPHLPEPR